jgi:hypothetical protein
LPSQTTTPNFRAASRSSQWSLNFSCGTRIDLLSKLWAQEWSYLLCFLNCPEMRIICYVVKEMHFVSSEKTHFTFACLILRSPNVLMLMNIRFGEWWSESHFSDWIFLDFCKCHVMGLRTLSVWC